MNYELGGGLTLVDVLELLPQKQVVMKSLVSFFILVVILATNTNAQLILDGTQSVEYLVQNVLLGEGVTATNVTFNGLPGNTVRMQVASFDSQNANVGLNSGLIMATGSAAVASGPNNLAGADEETGLNLSNGNDPDLNTLTDNANFNDWAIIEFDFIPAGDTLSFRYVFASEEYPEFVGQNYNDVFAFFISGPGINGTFSNNAINIALLPGTNIPVSVNNVNASNNNQYYLSNGDGESSPQNGNASYIQFDGMTVVLTARAVVECGQTYHFKIAIADVYDNSHDSAVFIEENSFQTSPGIQLSINSSIANQNNNFFEACGNNELVVSRAPGASLDDVIEIEISTSGTAVAGVDYESLPTNLSIPAGQASVVIPLIIVNDLIAEADETFNIDITANSSCSNANSLIELIIRDELPAPSLTLPDFTICPGEEVTIVPEIGASTGDNSFLWSTGETSETITLQPLENTTVVLTLSNDCTIADVVASCEITVLNAPNLTATLSQLDYLIQCSDSILFNPIVVGGTAPLVYRWRDENGDIVSQEEEFLYHAEDLLGGTAEFTVTDFCNREASVTVNIAIDESPLELAVTMPDSLCRNAEFIIQSSVSNTDGPFQWRLNNSPSNVGTWNLEASESQLYTISVNDECSRSGEFSQFLQVFNVESDFSVTNLGGQEFLFQAQAIGCENENCNYLWLVDGNEISGTEEVNYQFIDRSSVFLFVTNELGCQSQKEWQFTPAPLLFIPTAFTPNGDGINDVFKVEGGPFRKYKLSIFNTWGDKIFESTDIETAWTGSYQGGEYFCPDGIYNFVVTYDEDSSITIQKSGHVILMR